MYIPPTPFTPPSLANPRVASERVTFYYRLTLGEQKAWSERLAEVNQRSARMAQRSKLVQDRAALNQKASDIEAIGEAAPQHERLKAEKWRADIATIEARILEYADVEHADPNDLTPVAELIAGIVHGYQDKDGWHAWPSSTADAAKLLDGMPPVALTELLGAIMHGGYDADVVGKS